MRRFGQYFLQRARRADRLHAGGRLPVFRPHGNGLPGDGKLFAGPRQPAGAPGRPPRRAASGLNMKLRLKEEPKEWRKAAWMSALGLAMLSSLLRWRRILPVAAWGLVLSLLAGLAVAAALRPGWFRGYYRFSMKVGFGFSQLAGRVILALVFFIV